MRTVLMNALITSLGVSLWLTGLFGDYQFVWESGRVESVPAVYLGLPIIILSVIHFFWEIRSK